MGMNLIGLSKERTSFATNVWGWRPIHIIIDHINTKYSLGIDTTEFGFNNGVGVKDPETCKKLSLHIKEELKGFGLVKDEDVIYLALGSSWVKYPSREFLGGDLIEKMDLEKYSGKMLTGPIILKGGEAITPAYSTTKERMLEFCNFLDGCEGFEIW